MLGAIGIFLPILPTTPFLLLSAFCYLRSSKRMYKWLTENKILGKYIYNYIHNKGMEKSAKIWALVFLWSTLLISIYFMDSLHLRIFLGFVGIGVSVHLLMLKTLKKEEQ